jgi:hypothetical protein
LAVAAVPGRFRDRVVAAIFLAFGLGLVGAYALTLISQTVPPQKTDFITYFAAARLVVEGHAGSLYNFAALSTVERHVIAPYRLTYGVLPYIYPPCFAVGLAPLGFIGLVPAYGLWAALNALWLCLALVVVQRRARLGVLGSAVLWLGTLTFVPTFIGLLQGQVSFLLLALLGGTLLSLERRLDAPAGACLALAMIKPTYVLPCLVVLLARGRWRAIISFAGATVLLTLLPMLVGGTRINTDYVETLRRAMGWTTQFGYGPEKTASLAGPLRDLLPPGPALAVLAVLTLAGLVLVAVVARRSPAMAAPFALAVVVGLLISPHVLIHDLVLLLIPVGVALQLRQAGPGWLPLTLGAVYAFGIFGLVLADYLHVQLIILVMCALAAWLALTVRTPGQETLRAE